jgi:hypothetical protein
MWRDATIKVCDRGTGGCKTLCRDADRAESPIKFPVNGEGANEIEDDAAPALLARFAVIKVAPG